MPGEGAHVMIATEQLAEVFVEVADTLVDDFDLIDFMQRLTTRSAELFDVSAAGLLLADHHGRLQLMAASDERTEMLELFQLQAHEGPCHDCFRQGSPVSEPDLAKAGDRWPRFALLAAAAGFGAVHAFPMRLRGEVIGALNLFNTEPGEMDAVDTPASTATFGSPVRTAFRYSAGWRSNTLVEGIDTTRTGIPSAASTFCASTAMGTSEPVAMTTAFAPAASERT